MLNILKGHIVSIMLFCLTDEQMMIQFSVIVNPAFHSHYHDRNIKSIK
jgi:hypothetical protein